MVDSLGFVDIGVGDKTDPIRRSPDPLLETVLRSPPCVRMEGTKG